MPRLDFFNQNSGRAYPLLDSNAYLFSGVALADDVLLDAGFIVGLDIEHDSEGRLTLDAIGKTADSVYFVFTPHGSAYSTTVTVPTATTYGTTIFAESDAGAHGGGAYVVVGNLDTLLSGMVAEGEYTADQDTYVEPGTIQYLENTYVKHLMVATEKDDPCDAMCTDELTPRWDFAVVGDKLTGDKKLYPGYNCYIDLDSDTNTLTIGAEEGAGDGIPCTRPTVNDLWSSSSSSASSEICLTCKDTVSTINGVMPADSGVLRVLAGRRVSITDYPDDHKIVIDFTGPDSIFCDKSPDPDCYYGDS